MPAVNMCVTFLIIALFSSQVSCKWCTRLKAEQYVQTITEPAVCNRSYHANCGWFTRSQCTYYESVPCLKEHNKTVFQYKIVNECCSGFMLDPINNITCIRKPGGGYDEDVQYYDDLVDHPEDNLLLGLSLGAYAGIVCTILFVLCVAILVTLHIIKRKRVKLMAKDIQDKNSDLCEKMIITSKV